MNKLEAYEDSQRSRKGIVTAVHSANPDIRVDHCQQQTFIHICILKR